MSISSSQIRSHLVAVEMETDSALQPPSPLKSRRRGKYKPRLSTYLREAMIKAMKRATQARKIMRSILKWTERERETTKADIAALVEAAPITAMAHGLYADKLVRIGELDHLVARLSLVVGELDSGLQDASKGTQGVPAEGDAAGNGSPLGAGALNGNGTEG